MSEWQPIETAPRDGQPIVGTNSNSGITAICKYVPPEWCEIDRYGRYMEIGFYPTHWIPIPVPPEE